MLAPAEALLVSSSPAFDELHDSINIFILACFYRKLLKKRRLHSEREPTIVQCTMLSSTCVGTLNAIFRVSVPLFYV